MKKTSLIALRFLTVLPVLFYAAGCQGIYYKTMETFGHPKREILVDRVQDARDSQAQAKEQFKTALEKFSEVLSFSGGQLEEKYNQLRDEYEKSQSRAEAVTGRITAVKDVAEALFKEWQDELDQYSSAKLRGASEKKLQQTMDRYGKLITAMERANDKTGPVLDAFKDQVLFLKHNLNAQAIASLQDELTSVEADISSLIREMEASIAEADAFIAQMAGEADR